MMICKVNNLFISLIKAEAYQIYNLEDLQDDIRKYNPIG